MNIDIHIDDIDIPVINRNLTKILSSLNIDSKGRISWPFTGELEIRKEIIRSRIKVAELKDKKEILKELIFKAVINLKKQRVTSIDLGRMKNELINLIVDYLNQEKIKFSIIFPFHARGELFEKTKSFKIFDTDFLVINWNEVSCFSGWLDFTKRAKQLNFVSFRIDKQIFPLLGRFTPLLVSTEARTSNEAFEENNVKYELMRSIFNLLLSFGIFTFQAGPPKPLGKIYPPPLYPIFNPAGKFVDLYYNIEPYNYLDNSLNGRIGIKFNSILRNIIKMKDEIGEIYIDSMQKYVHALDTFDWRDAFLALWQILENISLNSVDDNLKMSEIAGRIKNLLALGDTLEKYLVGALVETRNKLVHHGKFSKDALMEVNLLKIVTERALSNFYYFIKRFPDKKSLLHFYKYVTLNDGELRKCRKDIGSIIKMRKEKKKYLNKL